MGAANFTGDGNRGSQLATSGVTLVGDSALREFVKLVNSEKPAAIPVESPQPVSKFIWRYNSEVFSVRNGVWKTDTSVGWQGISATIISVMPLKGQRGKIHRGLVASVRFWTTNELNFASVARAYWVGKRESDIEIDAGQSAKLVLLCFEADPDQDRLEWVGFTNPYVSEEIQSDWGPGKLELGEKAAIAVSGFPTIEVSIMDRHTREVLDSRRLQITIKEGLWKAEELS